MIKRFSRKRVVRRLLLIRKALCPSVAQASPSDGTKVGVGTASAAPATCHERQVDSFCTSKMKG